MAFRSNKRIYSEACYMFKVRLPINRTNLHCCQCVFVHGYKKNITLMENVETDIWDAEGWTFHLLLYLDGFI